MKRQADGDDGGETEKRMNGCGGEMFGIVQVNGFVMPLTED